MNDLIENLKIDAEWAERHEWDAPICLRDDMLAAIATVEKLKAYEDTRLEPEAVRRLQQDWTSLIMTLDEFGGMPHLRELVQAEKDGRLVVLPCKVGDTVWMIVTKRPRVSMPEFSFIKRSSLTWNNMHRILLDFGKTVFLTREEAEAALTKGGQNGGQ